MTRHIPTIEEIAIGLAALRAAEQERDGLRRELSDALDLAAMIAQGMCHDGACGSGYECVRCTRDRYRAALVEIAASYGCGERCQWCDRIDHVDECPVGRAAQALEVQP